MLLNKYCRGHLIVDTAISVTCVSFTRSSFLQSPHHTFQVGELFSYCFVSFKVPKRRNDVLESLLLHSKTD